MSIIHSFWVFEHTLDEDKTRLESALTASRGATSPTLEKPDLQPTIRPAGLKSPTVISLQLAGLLVFLCLWLPLCRGCSGTTKIPIESLNVGSQTNVGDWLFDFMLLGSYGNGLLVALLISVTAWFANERLWKLFFLTQFGVTLSIGVALVAYSLWRCTDLKTLLETTLSALPPLLGFSIWVGLAIQRRAFQSAWARLQHSWTIAALFFVHLLILFQGSALYGYWLTLIGLVGMLVAVELARLRMQHDLWDASQRVLRPQFSIRSILIWTALFPIVFGYYRAIEPLCNWIFK